VKKTFLKTSRATRAHQATLISVSVDLSQTPTYAARPRTQGYFIAWYARVYTSAFAGTHCAYPCRDGQKDFPWVGGYIARWFALRKTFTHTSINRALYRVSSFIGTKTISLSQTATLEHTKEGKERSNWITEVHLEKMSIKTVCAEKVHRERWQNINTQRKK